MRSLTLLRAKQKIGLRLLLLFLGSGMVGWLLISYRAPLAVWFITEAMMLYLAWAGMGAIALSIVGALVLVWSATLFHREAEFLTWFGLPFTSAQNWATELLLNWLLAMVLIFRIAFTCQWLEARGWNRANAFCLLAIVTSLGLSLVQLMKLM
ncbi:MAG: hypothetical protein ACAF41_29705 [Leptolyngbya sp. BL-A-14]